MGNIYVKLVDRGSIYQDTLRGIVVVSDRIVEIPKDERAIAAIRNGVLVEVKEEDLPEDLKPKVEEVAPELPEGGEGEQAPEGEVAPDPIQVYKASKGK